VRESNRATSQRCSFRRNANARRDSFTNCTNLASGTSVQRRRIVDRSSRIVIGPYLPFLADYGFIYVFVVRGLSRQCVRRQLLIRTTGLSEQERIKKKERKKEKKKKENRRERERENSCFPPSGNIILELLAFRHREKPSAGVSDYISDA